MRASILLIASVLVSSLPAFAKDIETTSTITAITVYPDRATVTRTASVDLSAGANAVVIGGLPQFLFTDSLRAEGHTTGDVVLGAIESKSVSSAQLAAPRERELNAQLQSLNDQRAILSADQEALQQKHKFLSSLGEQAALRARENIAAIDLKPQQWKEAAATIGNETSEILHQIAAKAVDLRKLDEQTAAIQEELDKLRTDSRSSLQVRVPVEAKEATRLTLSISYQLGNATWSPIYDARLDTASGKINLVQFGQVRQRTGEDWTNVKMTLSTAQPTRGASLPALSPMWVNLFRTHANDESAQSFQSYGGNAISKARNMLAAQTAPMEDKEMLQEPMAAPTPQKKEATFQVAQINAGGFASEYAIPGSTDVPADNSVRKVMIGNLDMTGRMVVKVKPQVSTAGFLTAVTKLSGESPLLAGNVNLFRDGVFVGTTPVPLLRPDEEIDLGFGIDDQVSVKQRVMKDEKGENGVVMKQQSRTRHTITEIQNLHRTPIRVSVLQTTPAARDEKIKVKILPELTREGYATDVNNITGQLRWEFDLESKKKTEVGLGWTLTWPNDENISGLPF